MIRKHLIASAGACAGLLFAMAPAMANVSGSMSVLLTLENGCIISGSSAPLGAVDFGTMDFGIAPTLFANDLQAQAVLSGTPVQLECSAGVDLNIQVGSGQNESGGIRRLAAGGNYVQYRLYTQANGAGEEYAIGGAALDLSAIVPAGGGTFDLPIYGLISQQADLLAGSYSDLVSITLTF